MKVVTNVRVDEDIIRRLRELEKKTLIRFSVHVEQALKQYLEQKENSHD